MARLRLGSQHEAKRCPNLTPKEWAEKKRNTVERHRRVDAAYQRRKRRSKYDDIIAEPAKCLDKPPEGYRRPLRNEIVANCSVLMATEHEQCTVRFVCIHKGFSIVRKNKSFYALTNVFLKEWFYIVYCGQNTSQCTRPLFYFNTRHTWSLR